MQKGSMAGPILHFFNIVQEGRVGEGQTHFWILPKAQRTQGLSSAYQSNLFRSNHKFKHKSWSTFIFRISTKHQLQNLNQTSTSRLNLKFKILTTSSFTISTKIQLHSLHQMSSAKFCPNFSFKISPELFFCFPPSQVKNDWNLVKKWHEKCSVL